MNEFNPGNVVFHPKYGCGVVQDDIGWVVFADDADSAILPDVADDLHRLVVIDAEDPEQVEWLAGAHQSAAGFTRWDALHPNMRRDLIDAMQTALREFANPEPSKPKEPTAREELAVELGIAGGVARGIPRLEIDRALRRDPALRATYITQNAHLADALLASPTFARNE